MKKLALVLLLALEIAVCGCGATNNNSTTTNTQATGNWEAQMTGGTDQTSLLNFVTSFTVTNSGPLDITGFGFFNSGACFTTGSNAVSASGSANFITASTNTVTGTLNLTVKSTTSDSVLTLNGTLTGTSNGTTTTTGALSNGVVVGNWTISSSNTSCNNTSGSNAFIMCQDKATCTPTTSAASIKKPN